MKLDIEVTLDSGGVVKINGEGLTAEDVNEVFGLLTGYTVGWAERRAQSRPVAS